MYPGGSGRIIHIYDPKFRTQKPRSESYPSSVCGVIVSLVSGAGHSWARPTGRVMVDFATALELERQPSTPADDPRPRFPEDRRFCGKCVGVWLEKHRRLDIALDMMLAPANATVSHETRAVIPHDNSNPFAGHELAQSDGRVLAVHDAGTVDVTEAWNAYLESLPQTRRWVAEWPLEPKDTP